MAPDKNLCFKNEPLSDYAAIGAVGAETARIWVRSERPGRLRVSWHADHAAGGEAAIEIVTGNDSDNTGAITIPAQGVLQPLTRYRFSVTHQDGHPVGHGSFETAPASHAQTPGTFSIGLMSCHQPFDAHGRFLPGAQAMVRATRRCMEQHNTKMLLMVGDQMYTDYPKRLSLFSDEHFEKVAPAGRRSLLECSAEEVTALYHERYRHYWNMPELRQIQTEYPTYMIWDDHDIVDNWGSDPAHSSPRWRNVGTGARRAAFSYQASRVMNWEADRAFDYPIVYGHTPIYVMDLRSERRVGDHGRLFSEEQEKRLRGFLEEHAAKPIAYIVLSVPIIHLPRFLTQIVARLTPSGEDFSDRWSSWSHVRDRDRFLKLIQQHQSRHPKQRVVFLSGDIHIGCVHELRWNKGAPHRLFQVVSSGYTHETSRAVAFGSKTLIRLTRSIRTRDRTLSGRVRFFRGTDELRTNPCGGLNFALLEISSNDGGETAGVRFDLYNNNDDEPVCVYRSPVVTGGRPD